MNEQVNQQTLATLKKIIVDITQMHSPAVEIADDANIFDDCGVDSTSVVDLVLRVEETFGIMLPEDELDAELFQNLSNLAAFVERKAASKPAPALQTEVPS